MTNTGTPVSLGALLVFVLLEDFILNFPVQAGKEVCVKRIGAV